MQQNLFNIKLSGNFLLRTMKFLHAF